MAVLGLAVPSAAWAQGDAAKGEKRFEDCASCHSLKRGENGVGPTLFGMFDRKAAEVADFRYSPAMRRSAIVWTAKSLDDCVKEIDAIADAARSVRKDVVLLCHGGPISMPDDARYIL